MKCASCDDKRCYRGKNCAEIDEKDIREQMEEEDKIIAEVSAEIETRGYMRLTRLEELICFSRMMRFRRLGIAFCIGLEREARILQDVLSRYFEVFSVCCKICGIDKSRFNLRKLDRGYEAMCNPIGQAIILNRRNTDLNIILGLCIGHDMLFSKYSSAPVTTFAVKDRVLAHNPLGAIYSGYYGKKFK